MIPVAEFKQFAEQQPAFKVLKPWWDVTQDKIICLPSHEPRENLSEAPCQQLLPRGVSEHMGDLRELSGLRNNLDLQQYSFINQLCYETALHWYAKYFPYLVVIHTLIFMVCTSFWFKFPSTSSKIEHFISILGKCFDSPWTTRALSEVSGENHKNPAAARRAMVTMAAAAAGPGKAGEGEKEKVLAEPEKVVTEPPAVTLLDKKEGEQAKALFEKVKKFRMHVEEGDILYTMYIRQTVLKVCKFLAILVYNLVYVGKISFLVACRVETSEVTGYASFCCNHTKAHLFSKLAFCYISFVCVYGITCFYTLCWLFHRPLKEYSFRSVREETGMGDIPDVKNDFAFMLHLIDQYDSLYSKRFAVFLSEIFLRDHLKVIRVKCEELREVPLWRLSLHNDGARLLALNSLKKLVVLRELELHCRKLVTLRLWHNQIAYVPEHVRKLRGLEQLYLSHNKLETLPTQLGMCSGLRLLDISHNGLHSLPAELGLLQNLQHLALSYNALELLPDELFFCRKLRTLLLGYNQLSQLSPQVGALRALSRLELKGNRLEALPEELGNCGGLKKSGLLVEDTLYEGLPAEVRDRMEVE
ncbi:hypothetical protein E2I00_013663 [Balaenoptera physalus]|uniref:LRRC8 pannexin-like TM region domain-containing protein n=1 Tax=Balaenoptera physalus TaxID=9770 RepID=A0A6A1Q3E2_BALPH|nr:hypothetical protein E2I00_013663 [Balaenoptera physalus]